MNSAVAASRRRWAALPLSMRYAVISGACLVTHNIIVIGAAWDGATVLQAATLSFCVMVVLGYLALCIAVFGVVPGILGFGRYLAAMTANFPISTGILWLFAHRAHIPVAAAAPLATAAMVAVNYLWAHLTIGHGRPTALGQCAF